MHFAMQWWVGRSSYMEEVERGESFQSTFIFRTSWKKTKCKISNRSHRLLIKQKHYCFYKINYYIIFNYFFISNL